MVQREPVAFLSYARADDGRGDITTFRDQLAEAVSAATGADFHIFQDRNDIGWGQQWRERINESLDAVTFLIPILTPRFFQSENCRDEVRRFLERERQLQRTDLILPVYFIEHPPLNDEQRRRSDDLLSVIATHQYADWRELRYEPVSSATVRRALDRMAAQIRDALGRVQASHPEISNLDGLQLLEERAQERLWLDDRELIKKLQAELDELKEQQKSKLEIFVTDPAAPEFRFADPLTPGQDIVTIGVRALGVATIHNVEIRIAEYVPANTATPTVAINTVEPLEIVRGAHRFGRARPGQPVYAQVVSVRRLPNVALPEVRVSYMNAILNERYAPLPVGEWRLKIVATGDESPAPAEAYFHLAIQDDPDNRVRLKKLKPAEIDTAVVDAGGPSAPQ